MEKLLVMGGSYFIGKHVVETLKKDYELYVLNRGNNPLNDPEIHELVADRNDGALLKRQLRNINFQHVIDLSAFNKFHVQTLCIALNLNTLKSYVFISSGAVYNINHASLPFNESGPLGGKSPYGAYAEDKIAAEKYLQDTLDANVLSILRPPFVYGENNYLSRERLLFHLIENNLTVFIPNTNNTIQFVYVKDLAQQIQAILLGDIKPGIYNVGDEKGVTFEAFTKACADAVGKDANIKFVDPEGEHLKSHHFFPFLPYDYVLDVTKIHQQKKIITPLKQVLTSAYQDYLSLNPVYQIPPRMQVALSTLKEKYE